ncbi:MAG: hypothetical protein MSC31_19500 [Solirubrobacteraceae bacterium MAG38_C4-C5]|nr:hypothetical protein [Candidatus Siliceabacter maunaloa]
MFRSFDAFDEPLHDSVEGRLILYPAAGYELPEPWFRAVASAAKALGETRAYYGVVEAATAQTLDEAWSLPLEDETPGWFERSANDGTRNPIAESALWSTFGTWGILLSHRQHVVVGGPRSFVHPLSREINAADDGVIRFVQDMAKGADVLAGDGWLRHLLRHVYGSEQSEYLLHRARRDP